MNLLAIDTSGPVCGVALMVNQQIVAEHTVQNQRKHSVNLMPMIDATMQAVGLTFDSLDRLAVVTGPGSFTGVRLGVSTAKGLAHGVSIPCVAVNALEALAVGIGDFSGIICPIQDARAGQVYGAAFSSNHSNRPVRLLEDKPIKLEQYLDSVRVLGDKLLFLGDGVSVHQEKISAFLGNSAMFADPHQSYLRPASVAWLGILSNELNDYLHLSPMYLRAPSAERNRKLMEATHGM